MRPEGRTMVLRAPSGAERPKSRSQWFSTVSHTHNHPKVVILIMYLIWLESGRVSLGNEDLSRRLWQNLSFICRKLRARYIGTDKIRAHRVITDQFWTKHLNRLLSERFRYQLFPTALRHRYPIPKSTKKDSQSSAVYVNPVSSRIYPPIKCKDIWNYILRNRMQQNLAFKEAIGLGCSFRNIQGI